MKIKILPHGPYEVSGKIPLLKSYILPDDEGYSESWKDGKPYEDLPESYHLCRCGRSSKKPFCNGAHRAFNFDGTETAENNTYDERAELIVGQTINLLDDDSLCAGARFCDRKNNVWESTRYSREDNNEADAIFEASSCPAGRLTAVKKNGEKIESVLEKEIALIQDVANQVRGPLWVKGGIEIESSSGEMLEKRNRVTLCRCGESSNLPYCDASHYQCSHMQGLDE
jgi:CDGSH-type Zn-finger protein